MSCLVIGEALIDVVYRADGATRHTGGSPTNVAVGLARLGRKVKLLTRFGDDPDGDLIGHYLHDNGVEVIEGAVDTEATSIALATLDETGSAIYRFDVHSNYREPPSTPEEVARLLETTPRHVHIGSIGAHLRPGSESVQRWVELLSPYSTVSYDPNVRLSILGSADLVKADIGKLLPYIDIFKASTTDLHELAGEQVDPDEVAKQLISRGVSLVALSLGEHGLSLYTLTEKVTVPAIAAPVVDTVGAGDALTAALIDALARVSVLGEDRAGIATLSPQMLTSVAAYAVTAAGITVTRKGANPPTREELNHGAELFTTYTRGR